MIARALIFWFALTLAIPATAQTSDTPFRARAAGLVTILQSAGQPDSFFGPSFLANVPVEEIRRQSAQLVQQYGPVKQIKSVTAATDKTGFVLIDYERARVRFEMTIDPEPPHRVIGLRVSGADPINVTAANIIATLNALPGQTALIIRRLGPDSGVVLAHHADKPMAIGSGYKLWILAELVRATRAGDRRWDDVVPLGAPALPGGITQTWPKGTPMTLHSLAVLMMSISDNTAADTLLGQLGRRRVDDAVRMTGHANPAATVPVLSTNEAFALKMDANADLRERWARADLGGRSALIRANAQRLTLAQIDPAQLGAKPRHIATVGWTASPADMANALDWLLISRDQTALDILAVNPGMPPGDAARFGYAGFKGGSEPGVTAMHFLVQNKAGVWFAVAGSWNNVAAPVSNDQFTAVMQRALALVR